MDYAALKSEIDSDPLTRGYAGMTDAEVASNMSNVIDRPAEGSVDNMAAYVFKNRSRTNNGADTTQTTLYGRLKSIADATIGTDPFGTTISANEVTLEMKHAAIMFIALLQSPFVFTLDFIDTEVDAAYTALGPGQAVVWKTPDIDALKGFSQNQQSRGNELGFGKVREGDVIQARAS